MNWRLIGSLIRLRYTLLRARGRSENGRIALLAMGCLLFLLITAALSGRGFHAGMAAIRFGNVERVSQIVLSTLFLSALFLSVIMGLGVSSVFTDAELRRYPLNAFERFTVHHFHGLADGFWFLIFAVEIGLAVGLYVYGAFSWLNGAIAAFLFFFSCYVAARAFTAWIDRLMTTASGYVVMFMLFIVGALAPAAVLFLQSKPGLIVKALPILIFTPPFAAAAAMTHRAPEAYAGLAIVGAWLVIFLRLLIAVEHRPAASKQRPRSPGPLWNNGFDSLAAMFGRRMSPLVGHWLRFYWRNNRFRVLYPLSLPFVAMLAVGMGRPRQIGDSLFVGVLGCLALVTWISTAPIAVNQYGYTGGGFRRFQLLPTDPGASLRAGSYAAMLLGALWIPPATIVWAIVAPHPLDARILFMPVMNAVTALFLFNGLALWTSIYAPKRGRYDSLFQLQLSGWGNVVRVGPVLGCMLLPLILRATAPRTIAPENWWLTLPAGGFAFVFYLASLAAVNRVLPGRREALLAVVEGRA
jgi:hypothetical protein